MKTYYVAVDGPPVSLGDGAQFKYAHVVVQFPSYGRFLFASNVGIVVYGQDVLIEGCYVELL